MELLNDNQINDYNKKGYVLIKELLNTEEVSVLQKEIVNVLQRKGPEIIYEKNNPESVRLVFGAHIFSKAFNTLSRLPKLLAPSRQLVGEEVYIHQSRINPKQGFGGGGSWEWHQDYPPWHVVDEMPKPNCVITSVFIDDCTIEKSPLLVMPGSHTLGLIDSFKPHPDARGSLLYHLDKNTLNKIATEYKIEPILGKAGSVLFMNCNLVHGSANNISPWKRTIIYIVYNAVSNLCVGNKRPWYQQERNNNAIKIVDNNVLSLL